MKKIVAVVFSMLVICAVSAVGFANGNYNNSIQPTTVAELKANAWDDQHVIVDGQFTNKIYKDVFNFKDNEGNEIAVEVDDDCWYQLSMNTPVRIYAEVDKDWHGEITLDVQHIEKL